MHYILVVEAEIQQPESLLLEGYQEGDIVLVVVHLIFIVLGELAVGDDIMIKGLHISKRQDFSLNIIANVGALHEESGADLIGLVEVLLG